MVFRKTNAHIGRHVSVTLEPRLESVHQVLAVYQRIRQLDGLVMLM